MAASITLANAQIIADLWNAARPLFAPTFPDPVGPLITADDALRHMKEADRTFYIHPTGKGYLEAVAWPNNVSECRSGVLKVGMTDIEQWSILRDLLVMWFEDCGADWCWTEVPVAWSKTSMTLVRTHGKFTEVKSARQGWTRFEEHEPLKAAARLRALKWR
jgi:hypothetical protein